MAGTGTGDARSLTEEIEQYRGATEETLGQRVDYLHGLRENRIARVIQTNVAQFRRQVERT